MHLIFCESTGKAHIQRTLAWSGPNFPKPALCGYQPREGEIDAGDVPVWEAKSMADCRRCEDLAGR